MLATKIQMSAAAVFVALIAVISVKSSVTTHAQERGQTVQPNDPSRAAVAAKSKPAVSFNVKVIQPKRGDLQRVTVQAGSVQAYESVRLFAKLPGFLKKQNVDIGDRVKRGEVLAVVDVPELEAQVKHDRAYLDQARARVQHAKTKVIGAEAALETAKLAATQADATVKGAAVAVRFRLQQLRRMENLFKTKSVEEKLVDESKERYEAAVEAEQAAKIGVATAKAQVLASMANIEQFKAGLATKEAGVTVAQASLDKAQVQLSFATIVAPFDGVITRRGYFPGDFIRAANSENHEPLVVVERIDLMRVVVAIPEQDVPLVDAGDAATLEIDAFPGKKWSAKVSRIASSEDPKTRTMRVEIDLPNPTGKILSGMSARVTIVLDEKKDVLSIPSACLVSKREADKGAVFIVRDGRAHLVSVRLGSDGGEHVGILSGLTVKDQVIFQPSKNMSDGDVVTPSLKPGSSSSDGQEPAKKQEKGAKLKELQKERLAATRDLANQASAKVKNGIGMLEELIEATRMLLEAELDVCESNKEGIAVLEKSLVTAKETERLAEGFANKGVGRQSTALLAKVERLRIEIALERARTKAAAKPAGGKEGQDLAIRRLSPRSKQQ